MIQLQSENSHHFSPILFLCPCLLPEGNRSEQFDLNCCWLSSTELWVVPTSSCYFNAAADDILITHAFVSLSEVRFPGLFVGSPPCLFFKRWACWILPLSSIFLLLLLLCQNSWKDWEEIFLHMFIKLCFYNVAALHFMKHPTPRKYLVATIAIFSFHPYNIIHLIRWNFLSLLVLCRSLPCGMATAIVQMVVK